MAGAIHAKPGVSRVAALPQQSARLCQPDPVRDPVRREPACRSRVQRQAADRALRGQWYVPIIQTLPETTFGGDFPTPTDYLDPLIRENLAKPGNFALYPLNPYHHRTINYFSKEPNPARPSADNRPGYRRPRPGPGGAAALRVSSLGRLRLAGNGDLRGLRRALRLDPGLLRRLDRYRHGAIQRDLERDADAVHVDHLFVAVLAQLLAARHPAVDIRLVGHRGVRARGVSEEQDARLRARGAGRSARATGRSCAATYCPTASRRW